MYGMNYINYKLHQLDYTRIWNIKRTSYYIKKQSKLADAQAAETD